MSRYAMLLFLLLVVPLASAQSEYWAIAAEDGTTMDVVNAANFAASMKGSVAVSFTGKTFEQARDSLIEQPLEDTVAVVFDGDDALVMANEDRFPKVVEASVKYLRGQGFSVDVEDPDTSYFLGEEEVENPQACPMDAKVCPDGSSVGRNPETCEFLPCPVVPEPREEPPAQIDEDDEFVPPPRDLVEDRPNVLVRVWRWFAGIFS